MSTAMSGMSSDSIVVGLNQFRHTKETACPEVAPISRYLIIKKKGNYLKNQIRAMSVAAPMSLQIYWAGNQLPYCAGNR